jgi:hypothetical protein
MYERQIHSAIKVESGLVKDLISMYLSIDILGVLLKLVYLIRYASSNAEQSRSRMMQMEIGDNQKQRPLHYPRSHIRGQYR